jgi:predicted TIM-barrel fold metal-dependent hydrolase
VTEKLWAHSGDAHMSGEREVWDRILPKALADRMPRSVKDPSGEFETVHVDGRSFQRQMPRIMQKKGSDGRTIMELIERPQANDVRTRVADLDSEGIWAEIIYGGLGIWETLIQDRELIRAASRAQNEWKREEIQGYAPDRLVPTASVPLLEIDDAVAETVHAAEIGLHAISLPTSPPSGLPKWNRDHWEPLWSAAEEAGLVIGFHIGTDNDTNDNASVWAGPGGAVLNYVNTTWGGQLAAVQLTSSGVLDRHPDLRIIISEGGATWVPFMGDRMNEAYRQHGTFVRPVLSRLPKEILYRQVYASFQHDESAIGAMTALGFTNVCWGSDYPHIEGTFGHTQKTLHELFDDCAPEVRHRITQGAFKELFPHVSDPPAG